MGIRDEENDIWLWSLARQTLSRETFDGDVEINPIWTRDGRSLIFASPRSGAYNLFSHEVGATADVRLTSSPNTQIADSLTPDGASIIGREVRPHTKSDVFRLALTSDTPNALRSSDSLVQTPFDDYGGAISPDGRFLAYQSEESGTSEVYVRPYPQTASARWQVSSSGGLAPAWAKAGRELVYLDDARRMMSVSVDSAGPGFHAETPTMLFSTAYAAPVPWRSYNVTSDGQRFLMIKDGSSPAAAAAAAFVIVQHWADELKRLVPAR